MIPKIEPMYKPYTGRNSGNMWGMFDNIYDNGKGAGIKMDGWGGDALGFAGAVGNMFMTNKGIKSQEEMAKKQMEWQQEAFYKNFAMKMAGYREHRNDRSRSNAQREHFNANGSSAGFVSQPFSRDDVLVNRDRQILSDPSMVGSNGKTYNTGNGAQASNPIGSGFGALNPTAFNPITTGIMSANANNLIGAANQAQRAERPRPIARAAARAQTGAGLSSAPTNAMPGDAQKKKNQQNVNKVM